MISCSEGWGSRPSAPLVKTRLASPSPLAFNKLQLSLHEDTTTVTYPSEISLLLSTTSDFTIFKKSPFCFFKVQKPS